MSDPLTIKDVEILKPGTFWDAGGHQVDLSATDLAELATAYDPALLEAPVVVGHPKMDDPAYGWLANLRFDGTVLLADFQQVDPGFADMVAAGRFKNRSLSFFGRASRGNPKPGSLYPKHLGFLGARAPAVKGLKPVRLAAGDDAIVIELGSGWRMASALRSVATGFSRFRDWLIQEKGVDEADKILPGYLSDDLTSTAAALEADERAEPIPAFSTPDNGDSMTPDQIAAKEAELDKRQADLDAQKQRQDARETALAQAETDRRTREDTAFVEQLIATGKLRPTDKADVLAELAALDDSEPTIQLAAGEDGNPAKLTPRQAYRRRLNAGPKLVDLGEHADPDPVVALASGEDIARAAREYRDAEAKAGRTVTTAQAVTHVIARRS